MCRPLVHEALRVFGHVPVASRAHDHQAGQLVGTASAVLPGVDDDDIGDQQVDQASQVAVQAVDVLYGLVDLRVPVFPGRAVRGCGGADDVGEDALLAAVLGPGAVFVRDGEPLGLRRHGAELRDGAAEGGRDAVCAVRVLAGQGVDQASRRLVDVSDVQEMHGRSLLQ
ncbi:hypothetical protein GCM10020295_52260 [Streptomyces cinereospinus]